MKDMLNSPATQAVDESDLSSRPSFRLSDVPDDAKAYLTIGNPRLSKLRHEYERQYKSAVVEEMMWADSRTEEIFLPYFRGDNCYVWQYRDGNYDVNYFLTMYYVRAMDHLGILQRTKEDGLFGAYIYDFNNEILVSRDLIDSVVEMYFLERHLGISELGGVNVLDIGAGYGRLAHRMIDALPGIGNVYCTDFIPESTFISEYYLRFRNVDHKAIVVPFFDIEDVLFRKEVHVATSIHCLSECTLSSTEWWISRLARYGVRYIMIGGNDPDLHTGDGYPYEEALEGKGYRLVAKDPKYLDPSVQLRGVSPGYHFLFELS